MAIDVHKAKAFFDQTDLYLKNSFGIRLRAEIVRELLGDLTGVSLLDIGCGDGSISLQFISETKRLTLIDVSENMLEKARLNAPYQFREQVSYLSEDFLSYKPPEPFDVVLCLGVLAHVPSVADAVAKISSFLKPGGRCILQITDHDQFVAKLNRWAHSVRSRFSPTYQYATNRTTYRQLFDFDEAFQLILIGKRQYSLLLPGMGKLPKRFLYRYQRLTLQKRSFSRLGTEIFLLLEKRALV